MSARAVLLLLFFLLPLKGEEAVIDTRPLEQRCLSGPVFRDLFGIRFIQGIQRREQGGLWASDVGEGGEVRLQASGHAGEAVAEPAPPPPPLPVFEGWSRMGDEFCALVTLSGEYGVLRVGDHLPGQGVLVSVSPERIIFDQDGKKREIPYKGDA